MTEGERIAAALLSVDWSKVILETCARKRITRSTLARQVGSDAQHIGRLARGEITEPRFFRLAFKLLDEHSDTKRSEKLG